LWQAGPPREPKNGDDNPGKRELNPVKAQQ